MPKGLKTTSSPIQISGSQTAVTDHVATNFISKRVDLQLNPLDNEVFVVTGVKIDFMNPLALPDSSVAGTKVMTQRCSLSTGAQTVYAGIESPSVLGASLIDAQADVQIGAVNYFTAIEQNAMDAPPASMDYIGIIATNDFFINFENSTLYATNQTLGVSIRVYGYRAQADASTYAALVQSELLSQ